MVLEIGEAHVRRYNLTRRTDQKSPDSELDAYIRDESAYLLNVWKKCLVGKKNSRKALESQRCIFEDLTVIETGYSELQVLVPLESINANG